MKHEGQRLGNLQTLLDNERNSFNNRINEEISALSAKQKNVENEVKRLEDEKRKFNDYVSETKRGLENDRQEFINYVSISTKNVDTTASRLKEEEEKLNRVREELYREKAILEQKRIVASAGTLTHLLTHSLFHSLARSLTQIYKKPRSSRCSLINTKTTS